MDYLGLARALLMETDGTHPAEFIRTKALMAVAAALIAIAERLTGEQE